MIFLLFALFIVGLAHYTFQGPSLAVCYYPEQWDASHWQNDASEMYKLGIRYVRIADFAWHVIEPSQGTYNWTIFDSIFNIFHQHNLQIILATPTATPPKWVIDLSPSMILPFDESGIPRRFGSRRHYSFSSDIYREMSRSIVHAMAIRYGSHPALAAWQIDNEFGCHDTVLTYDPNALRYFRNWLREKYNGDINALNHAWGNVFWAMDYNSFDAIEFPVHAVTETNPMHRLEFQRFSSDQVISFAKEQIDLIKTVNPNAMVTTNMMGFFFQYDAYKLGDLLDFVSFDSYPLGFTDTTLGAGDVFTDDQKVYFAQTGHPDIAAFHHDLYKSVGNGHLWIMEQQPGPVNWAQHNPSPLPGMVGLWTWEAFAHGADIVNYFRWRRAPFAQEQMHAGLNRRDFMPDIAYKEVETVHSLLDHLQWNTSQSSGLPRAALFMDFESFWVTQIQPQGENYTMTKLIFNIYSALCSLGFEIDFLDSHKVHQVKQYDIMIVPGLALISQQILDTISAFEGPVLFTPRSGSKTDTFQIPETLPPSRGLQKWVPLKIVREESLRSEDTFAVHYLNRSFKVSTWREHVEMIYAADNQWIPFTTASFDNGMPAVVKSISPTHSLESHYLAFFPTIEFLRFYIPEIVGIPMPFKIPLENVRIAYRDGYYFAFNYDHHPIDLENCMDLCPELTHIEYVNNSSRMQVAQVTIWKCVPSMSFQ